MALRIGDSVVVKPGVLEPDFGMDIGGWQGRIKEIDDAGTALITWDSITLRQMGLDVAIRCENENLDWELMTLDTTEIERTASRDSEADVRRVADVMKIEMMDDPRLDAEPSRPTAGAFP